MSRGWRLAAQHVNLACAEDATVRKSSHPSLVAGPRGGGAGLVLSRCGAIPARASAWVFSCHAQTRGREGAAAKVLGSATSRSQEYVAKACRPTRHAHDLRQISSCAGRQAALIRSESRSRRQRRLLVQCRMRTLSN